MSKCMQILTNNYINIKQKTMDNIDKYTCIQKLHVCGLCNESASKTFLSLK